MSFEPMDFELEVLLKEIIDKISEGRETQINWAEDQAELSALQEAGLIKKKALNADGSCIISLTHSGSKYFDERSKWVTQQSRSIVENISDTDAEELTKLVVLSNESGAGIITQGFDANDKEESQAIARLSQRDFLKVKYYDNVPQLISITPEGYKEVKRISQTPEAKKGNLSTWIARLAGTFTGAVVKELDDM